MTTVFDVPADLLIKKVAEEFKNNDKINSPAWSNFVKTVFTKKENLKMSTGGIPDVHLSSEECTWTDL